MNFLDGLLTGFGIKTRTHRLIASAGLLLLLGFAAADWKDFKAQAPARAAVETQVAVGEVLQQSAIAQCREAVEFTNRRAKMGFDNVKTTKRGDILVEQPFSVPVFGMVERDNYIARCVLRKNGNFEFGIESDRRRLG